MNTFPREMKAWLLEKKSDLEREQQPLRLATVPVPSPGENEILIRVSCCGICHTELDETEGRIEMTYPVIPGHQVTGKVAACGKNAKRFSEGQRVGVAWIFHACGTCDYCRSGMENLCAEFKGTGCDANGGYAEYMRVAEQFAFALPDELEDEDCAPLLCAGAIAYRALKLSGLRNGQLLGMTGFGASAHLLLKTVQYLFPQAQVFVFARNAGERAFALELGANWAGPPGTKAPALLHAVIDTTPVWSSVTHALLQLRPGGRLVMNVIRKEESDKKVLATIRYEQQLWMEKEIKSVANITRADVEEFLGIAAKAGIRPEVQLYPFEKANEALLELRQKQVRGAKVLDCHLQKK